MPKTMIGEALKRASFCLKEAGIEGARTEAELLLSNILKIEQLSLLVNSERLLTEDVLASYQEVINRRSKGEPLAYITGQKYFYGFLFSVNREVLIPRPETELIVEVALQRINDNSLFNKPLLNCADLGTGSGILAISLAKHLKRAYFWAVDRSASAIELANLNASRHGVTDRLTLLEGDYFEALQHKVPDMRFDLIVSNPPYVSGPDMEKLPPEVKYFEPAEALFGGEDGLDHYRYIVKNLKRIAKNGALVILEIGAGQKEQIADIILGIRYLNDINWHYDLNGWPRVVEFKVEKT